MNENLGSVPLEGVLLPMVRTVYSNLRTIVATQSLIIGENGPLVHSGFHENWKELGLLLLWDERYSGSRVTGIWISASALSVTRNVPVGDLVVYS